MEKANHKRILKNTFMLYIRMLLAMVVGLYTSRVALEVLGVQDFGTYHVVAGFVALLGFMQGAMTTATQRYFAYDIGNESGANLHRLFNTSVQVHLLIGSCIFLVAETVGNWFVSTKLNIPSESLGAALMAYHLSVATFFISVMTVPLTAMLMAHERMKQFSFMGILDVILKLLAILLLPYLSVEKLAGYAGLLLFVALIIFSGYCYLHRMCFPSVRLSWQWDKSGFKSMLGFTGWNTCGNLAAVMAEQGNNVLLNIFFGPVVNAARAVAGQANGALNNFVMNIQAAFNPQIIKLYASNQKNRVHELVLRSSKYNFYILWVISGPVLFYSQEVLNAWLNNVPEYGPVFLIMTIIFSLIDSISKPIMTLVQATGVIRMYQSVVGGVLLLNVPISFIALQFWADPAMVLWVTIFITSLALIPRLILARKVSGLDCSKYFKVVIFRVVIVALVGSLISWMIVNYLSEVGIFWAAGFIIVLIINFFISVIFGLDKAELKFLFNFSMKLTRRFF